jgi:hypothetical protein
LSNSDAFALADQHLHNVSDGVYTCVPKIRFCNIDDEDAE